jgi:malate dehydrogenase (oxaloacetate-decarboxylating)(NADP+)
MFLAAAKTLAEQVGEDDLAAGRLYPALTRIREVSVEIAAAVAREARRSGLATVDLPDNLEEVIASQMYQPVYPHYA